MSAPHQRQIERELGAEKRTFRSVRAALLWYQAVLDGPAPLRASPLEQGSRSSQEQRDKVNATCASIRLCLRVRDPGVDQVALQHVGLLEDWHRAWVPQQQLAQKAGFPSLHALRLTMNHTQTVLEARMRARGLLREEQGR